MIVLMQRKARLRVQGELELRSQQFPADRVGPGRRESRAAVGVRWPSRPGRPHRDQDHVPLRVRAMARSSASALGRQTEQEHAATVDRLSRELGREPTDGELYRAQTSEWQERQATSLPRGDLTNKRRE